MAKTLNFRPAGFSSDEDASDEEGFSFAEPVKIPRNRKRTPNSVAPVNDVDLLKMAAINGNVPVLQSVIEGKAFPVDFVMQGWTPLMFAASNCQYDAMEFLLKKGANPNFHHQCYTVLMSACASVKQDQDVRLKCVQLLLDSGASVNVRQPNGITPLMIACKEGSKKVVKELIERNADINAQDVMGWTPLMWSVNHSKHGEMEVILLLLNAGADVSIKCSRGQTAHSHALNMGYHHIAAQIPTGDIDVLTSSKTEHYPTKMDSWKYLRDNLCGIDGKKWGLWQDVARGLHRLGMLHRYGQIFKESGMDLVKFLTLTEEELEDLSVIPLHRKRLLEATRKLHMKRWKEKSLDLRSIKNMQNSCDMVDEIKLIANIARQVTMIHASIAYVTIHMSPSCESEQGCKVEDLNFKLEATLNKANAFHNELQTYMRYITSNCSDHKYPPDWTAPGTNIRKLNRPFLATVVAVSVLGMILWRKHSYFKFNSSI
jgi:ankyrin repeat protein